jgi:BirA family biotin operon repressor/biotin-[acetyl-CoA-carboxylase] ligase
MTTDAHILAALRNSRQESVSGGDLAQRLGISRAAIWARIEVLRTLGYEIEASPHRGYRLLNAPDLLHADDLMSRLENVKIVGRDIRVFQETSSTSDVAEKFARDGVKEGVVVFAESQTRGRGRLGRRWWAAPGTSLLFSVLLRPNLHPNAATQIMAASAVALTRAIRQQTGCAPEIKWPNDLLCGGRKIAGILTELNAELDHVKYLIVGIGVDVNQERHEFPEDIRKTASSLRVESGRRIHRAELASAILAELDKDYARIVAGQFAAVADEWERQCATLGCRVAIRIGDRQVEGRAESLDADGALLIRTQHGRLERILGGDVTLIK